MKKAGFDVGGSKSKLSQGMLQVLAQLPSGTENLKEAVVAHLGMLGQRSATRDINSAWNEAKKKAARQYSDRFILDERKVLHWNNGATNVLDKSISSANIRKLNALAEAEGCTVDQIVSKLIQPCQKEKT